MFLLKVDKVLYRVEVTGREAYLSAEGREGSVS